MDAIDQDTVDSEIMRLSRMAGERKPFYYDFASRPSYGADLLPRSLPTGELSDSEIEEAASELSQRTGRPWADIMAAARSLPTGPSTVELTSGMASLAESALGWDGYSGSLDDRLALAAAIEADDTSGLAGAGGGLAEGDLDYLATQEYIALSASGAYDDDQLMELASSISASERREAARQGQALPDGSYPCRNRKELHAAAVLAASHHGDWRAARKLIIRRARELGVDLASLPGFGDDSADDGDGDADDSRRPARRLVRTASGTYESVPLSQEEDFTALAASALELADQMDDDMPAGEMAAAVARALMEADDQDTDVEAEVAQLTAEHPEYFGLARHSQRDATGKFKTRVRGQEHLYADPGSETDTDVAATVRRYLAMADGMFGAEKPYGSTETHAPKSFAQRTREQARARAGHTNMADGNPWADGRIGGGAPGGATGTLMPSSRR